MSFLKLEMFYLASTDESLNQQVCLGNSELFDKAKGKALQLLDNVGVVVDTIRIKFELVTREQMNEYGEKNIGLHFPLTYGSKIWILEKQTLLLTISTLAHELGHAWISQNKIKLPLIEEEGFCQVLSYYALCSEFSKEGNHEADLVKSWADEIYGDGFRLMKRKLDCLGWKQFIMLIKF